jgi:hypothetical protein
MAAALLRTDKISSPLAPGVEARLRWYDDGSVRISLTGSPWMITEAAMPSSPETRQVMLRLQPGEGGRHQPRWLADRIPLLVAWAGEHAGETVSAAELAEGAGGCSPEVLGYTVKDARRALAEAGLEITQPVRGEYTITAVR